MPKCGCLIFVKLMFNNSSYCLCKVPQWSAFRAVSQAESGYLFIILWDREARVAWLIPQSLGDNTELLPLCFTSWSSRILEMRCVRWPWFSTPSFLRSTSVRWNKSCGKCQSKENILLILKNSSVFQICLLFLVP